MRFSFPSDESAAIVSEPVDLCAVLCPEGFASVEGNTAWRGLDAALSGLLLKVAAEEQFTGKKGQSLSLHTHGKIGPARVLLLGTGKSQDFVLSDVRHAAARAARAAAAAKGSKLLLVLPATDSASTARVGQLATEGVLLAGYQFDRYLGGERKRPSTLTDVAMVASGAVPEVLKQGSARGEKVARGIMQARDLTNEQASEMTPTRMAAVAAELATTYGLECEILGPEECRQLGMGCFLAVARGSDEEPRFIHLTYRPKGREPKKRVALVGKSVTFDSGGLSLKTNEGMLEMKYDMGGGATVLSTMGVLAALDCPDEVHALCAATENMPSGRAYKLGDVLRSMAGKTVEINNTDAEGRLTLADAITFATQRIKPDEIFDFATLTGAALVALGPHIGLVMGNRPEMMQRFLAAAGHAGEDVWQMPLYDRLFEGLKSELADMKNTGERNGGALTAGLFLREFVNELPWIHVDMAGPVSASKEWGHHGKGATGFGVATLVEYLVPHAG
jgi:leucyl aminopeptidase